jgi:uncharacterized membrane protein
MPVVNKEVFINATSVEVFNFVSKPSNLLQIWPSLEEMKEVKLFPDGGYNFFWKYKIHGMHFTGTGECVDIFPHLWLSSKTHGSIESTTTWTFRTNINQKTMVTLTVDYHIPSPLLRFLAESTISKVNDRESGLILENLRAKFEKVMSK